MKSIMTTAWEIARNAAMKHGGNAIDYIAGALKLAWQQIKQGVKNLIKVTLNYGYGHSYIARIVGHHPKWKLDRDFLEADVKNRSYSGKTGSNIFYLNEDGIYEKASGKNRAYFIIENGEYHDIEYGEVLARI